MKKSDVFPSKWLCAADLQGREFPLTITEFTQMDVQSDGILKPVLRFGGATKMLILNVTNFGVIADMHGDETDNWLGKTITLFATVTQYAGKQVDCIRIRPAAPAVHVASAPVAAPVSSPPADDEIPF